MSKPHRYQSIDLLNFEGPVLKAYRCDSILEDGLFLIVDQWKTPVAFLNLEQFTAFLVGDFTVMDSAGQAWNYPSEAESTKPTPSKLKNFMFPNE